MGRRLPLHGGGHQVRSFIHVRDVSWAELAAMEEDGSGQTYNLPPDGTSTIRELVQRICTALGADFASSTEEVAARPSSDPVYTIDSSKARARLRWAPRIDLQAGLVEVIDWVERNWNAIRQLPLEYTHRP